MSASVDRQRRRFLTGAGVAVALPFLASLAPPLSRRAQAAAIKRLCVWYVPNGFMMRNWWPKTEGANYVTSPILAPLAPVKNDVLVIGGLDNNPGEQGIGDHPMGTGAFLTAAKVRPTNNGADVLSHITMDQVAAASLSAKTPGHLKSLQLAAEGASRGPSCDFYTCTYTDNISWSGPTTPMPKTTDARVVFDQLFAGFDPGQTRAAAEQRAALEKSVLDYVLDDAARLQPRLGARDKQKLDEYMTSVRDVEMRIQTMASDSGGACAPPARPGANLALGALIDVMSDLMALAFQCDRTRVITFMVGNGATERTHPFLTVDGQPIGDAYHPLTHAPQTDTWTKKITEICRWEIERFARFLGKLKTIDNGAGGTLLDDCAVLLSSEMADPSDHGHTNMPVLLAGKCGGGFAFPQGRYVRTAGTFGDLYVTMLNALGVPTTTFGEDGKRTLTL